MASSEIHRLMSLRWPSTGVTRLLLLLFLGLHLLLLFRTQLSLFLFFSFALVFASATVAHIHSSSVRLEARNAPRQASKTQRHSGSIAAPKGCRTVQELSRPSKQPSDSSSSGLHPAFRDARRCNSCHLCLAVPRSVDCPKGGGHVASKGA